MRIWSIHPKYLDAKGLVALWRETLLAKNVLYGLTKGYKNHPQLNRFKETNDPMGYINKYLISVYNEALSRRYKFDKSKIDWDCKLIKNLPVTIGQVNYEKEHLTKKLEIRDKIKYLELIEVSNLELHPLFKIIEGDVEKWEIIK